MERLKANVLLCIFVPFLDFQKVFQRKKHLKVFESHWQFILEN